MITIEDYADKVERFVGMWREGVITDIELVENIHKLAKDVTIIDGNYVASTSAQIIPRQG